MVNWFIICSRFNFKVRMAVMYRNAISVLIAKYFQTKTFCFVLRTQTWERSACLLPITSPLHWNIIWREKEHLLASNFPAISLLVINLSLFTVTYME